MDGLEIKTKPWRKGWKYYPDDGSWVVESSEWTIFVPSEATADFIAAAPDLYEALLDPGNKEKREAALAKARGEE